MTPTQFRVCACGATFQTSAADFTVRCPGCRGSGRGGHRGRPEPCVVCDRDDRGRPTGQVTYGPSAVDHRFTVVTCHRCSGSGVRP
jgi:hypothetical protein